MKVNDRMIAKSWAKNTVKRKDIVFLDTETTGIGKNAKVVDLGVIDRHGKILINILLNPEMLMPFEATKVNGITDQMLIGCPRFYQVANSIRKLLEGKTIIAWNAPFDKRMMENEFLSVGLEIPKWKWVDEMPMYGKYADKPKRNKLCYAAKECGIVEEQSHRAVGDCLFTLAVLNRMASV